MKIQRTIIPIIVIIAGIMLGVAVSMSLPSRKETGKIALPASPSIKQVADKFPVSLTIEPSSIKSSEELSMSNKDEKEKIDKAIITVTYTAPYDLKNNTLRFVIGGTSRHGMGAVPGGNAKPDSKLQSKDQDGIIFTTSDVKKGATQKSQVFLFARDTGDIIVTAQIMSGGNRISQSHPVTIKVTK